MRNRRWMCALGLFFGLGVSETAWAKDPSELHQDALRAFTEARYEEALRLFKEAYDATNTPEMLVRIGQTQLKLGRKAEAMDACQSYLSLTADRPEPMYRGFAEQCVTDAKSGLFPASSSARPTPAPAAATNRKPPLIVEEDDPPTPAPRPLLATTPPPKPVISPPAPPPPAVPPGLASSMTTTPSGASLTAVYDYCLRQQREGRTDSAQRCYEELLPNALRSSGMQEADITLVMSQIRRYPHPAAAVPWSMQKHTVEKRNTGLWAAGLTLWLSALVPAVVMGPLYADNPVYGEQADTQTHQIIHYTLMAPVVGPFISGIWLPLVSDDRSWAATHYTVPWIVADGVAQLVGVTMLVAGAQKTTYRLGPAASQIVRSLQVAPLKSQDLSGIAVIGRF
ncbi:MAG TPA: hypothetical protein PLY80_15215 [Pseudomonadota bacterium]|nr:hypothetical protein [Pseudomonadota bacterium]